MQKMTLLLIGCSMYGATTHAQDCTTIDYTTPQFSVRVELDVLYGTATRFDGGTDSLRMDVYKPVGDDVATRPLLVALHGGAFVGGGRDDMDELCQWYAARGYVAATVSYRLGFTPPDGMPVPYTYDDAEVIRAAYRASQDVKGAIRFLRLRHALDSTSTENVFVYGVSAGGITALEVTYLADATEKPAWCGALAPTGTTIAVARPDLGTIDGDLNTGADHSVKACVSLLGAMLDTTMVDAASNPALFMYHQTGDPVVGCGYQQGLWGAPLGLGANYPWLYGSCAIDPRMAHLGFSAARYEFHQYQGSEHDIHDIPLVDSLAAIFLARQFCPIGTGALTEVDDTDMQVYPQPATDNLFVRFPSARAPRLSLFAMDGRMLRNTVGASMEVRSLPAGTYVLLIDDGGGKATRLVQVAH